MLPLTPENLSEMFEFTAEIEAMSARFTTNCMTAAERAELETLHEASRPAVEVDNRKAYGPLNEQFHEAIFRATHNGFLLDQAIRLRTRLLPFRRAQLHLTGRVQSSF